MIGASIGLAVAPRKFSSLSARSSLLITEYVPSTFTSKSPLMSCRSVNCIFQSYNLSIAVFMVLSQLFSGSFH